MNHPFCLAALNMTGSYGPIIWAFFITFLLTACLLGIWTWWRSPARIQKRLRRDGLGLLELKNHFHLRGSDWLWSFLIALIFTVIASLGFYFLLPIEAYQGLPFWLMLTTSKLTSQTVFMVYHPMPYGILAAIFLGLSFGRLLGLMCGKKFGAKRVLLTSRLRDSVKF